jgi:urea transport system permease protein
MTTNIRKFLAALAAAVFLLKEAAAVEASTGAAAAAAAETPAPNPSMDSLSANPAPEDAASAAAAPLSAEALLDSLLASPDTRTERVKALIALDDEGLGEFFLQLSRGNVYEYAPSDGAAPVLAIAGPPEEKDGDAWVRLYKPYPYGPLPSADGGQAEVLLSDIVELDTDREVRMLVQPVLTAMELRGPDPVKRKNAALALGESGDTTVIPVLLKAIGSEKDEGILHHLHEAVGRLELLSPDPARRKAAAEALGKAHATNALPALKAKTTPDESGSFPEADADARAAMLLAVKKIEAWNSYTSVIQNLFSGLSLGSILILMALGLAIIFGLMGVINMAHGEFMMIGAYTTFIVQGLFMKHVPEDFFGYFLAVSLPLSFLVAGAVGMLIEATIIKRLYGRPLETLLATWGISLILIQAARHRFGDLTAVSSPKLLSQGWEVVQGVVLPYNRIFILFLTLAVVGAMALIFYRTRMGITIRAVTQNRGMSSCLGIGTRRVDMFTFGLGTGIAGLAGCALTQIGNVDPGMGQNYIVDSFLVVVTGGVGKLAGTVISGLGIGGLNKFLEPFLQSVYAKVTLLGLVILFLQRRPSGLFPAKGRNEDL